MKPHPKLRKTIKWGGAVVTVLIAGMLVTNHWWHYDWSWGRWAVYSYGGALGLEQVTTPGVSDTKYYGFSATPYLHQGISWWSAPRCGNYTLRSGMRTSTGWRLEGPTLLALGITFVVTASCWVSDLSARRRSRDGLCPKCNYDRAGIAGDAKCPECGSVAP